MHVDALFGGEDAIHRLFYSLHVGGFPHYSDEHGDKDEEQKASKSNSEQYQGLLLIFQFCDC